MKKKVCMVVPSFEAKGGIAAVVSGYQNSELVKEYDIKFVETYRDGNKIQKLMKALMGYVQFIICLLFWKPDIIHIHSAFGPSFIRKTPYIYLSAWMNRRIVNHIHGADFDEFYRRASQNRKNRVKQIYDKCDCLIALSEEWKENLSEVVAQEKIVVVENYSVLNEKAIEDRKNKSNENIILFLGYIGQRKGCFDIPDIMDLVSQKKPEVKFILGGDGEVDSVKALLKPELEKNIEFPGWVRGEEKDALLRKADVFFLPSYNEGMPMSILDAMGYGLPIVSTTVGGISRIVKEKENGYVFEPSDTQGMAGAIVELLENDKKRKEFGENSIRIVEEGYSLETHVRKLLDIYRSVVERVR